MEKAILFIDGNNFYHNFKKLKLNPNEIDFFKLAKLIFDHYKVEGGKIVYYNSIPDIRDGKEMYYKHMQFLSQISKLPKFEVKTRKLQKQSTAEVRAEKKENLSDLNLCDKCKDIVEGICFDCIGKFKKKEKGIDVMIAVDMVESAINDRCDFCILLSGDADFIPAMNLIKENRKKAASASSPKGYSFELREKFPFFVLKKELLLDNCMK